VQGERGGKRHHPELRVRKKRVKRGNRGGFGEGEGGEIGLQRKTAADMRRSCWKWKMGATDSEQLPQQESANAGPDVYGIVHARLSELRDC